MITTRKIGLDVMRTSAILMVIAGHFFKFLGPLASFGVELFFVLSGFLIGGILLKKINQNGDFNLTLLTKFWIRRWFRTLPNYYLFIIINLICFKFLLYPDLNPSIPKFIFFLQNFAWPRETFYSESWSLCVEEWFYLLFPLFYFFIFQAGKRIYKHKKEFSFFITILFFIVSVPIIRYLFAGNNPEMHMIVIYRLDSVMYGVLLAFLKSYQLNIFNKMIKITWAAFALSIMIIAYKFSLLKTSTELPLVFHSLIPLIFSLLLPFCDQNNFTWVKGKTEKAFINLSKWSYSIYLIHLPVLLSCNKLFLAEVQAPFWKLFIRIALILLVILLSKLNFEKFELPLTHFRDRYAKS